MAAAIDVARQFVRLAWHNEEPEGLTHMRPPEAALLRPRLALGGLRTAAICRPH